MVEITIDFYVRKNTLKNMTLTNCNCVFTNAQKPLCVNKGVGTPRNPYIYSIVLASNK